MTETICKNENPTAFTMRRLRNAIIEECACIADGKKPGFCGDDISSLVWDASDDIAKAIRALKDLP